LADFHESMDEEAAYARRFEAKNAKK
jgi:hypothetical protein